MYKVGADRPQLKAPVGCVPAAGVAGPMATEMDDSARNLEVAQRETDDILEKIGNKAALAKFKDELTELFSSYKHSVESATTTERKIQELTDELNNLHEQVGSKIRSEEETVSQKKTFHSSIEEGFAKLERLRALEKTNKSKVSNLLHFNPRSLELTDIRYAER